MSTTIDEKVVEMRFDNRDFEKNIKDTMKTLDEFKKQLNFSGASDGLENISQYANKINFNSLGKAIDIVNERFSALGVIGITALQNITNSAINAGKRIVDSLTIAPIRSGYEEYELTLNTIKTVMNATNKSAKEVKAQLKSLDDYADKTIYSTGDMFNNISKFTNVGVPLEDASTAMIGIANATALAGRGAREASMAMYNLGQAVGVGYLSRIDYKSLQLAGIDTNEWKEAMIDAALAAGTLTKAQDGMYKSGNKLYTMQNLFIDGLQTQWATRDVMMKVLTDYGSTETEIGKKAWKAAQEVRTFSGMMEALKASVGTGWKETWDLIFGDLDKATSFWTRINDFVSGIIGGFTKKRNEFLQGVLDPINPLLEKIGKSADAVKETVDAVKDYVNIVDDIIAGKWGNGQSRWDKLTEAGYDWAYAQNLVNERLGSSVRHATNFSESQKQIINSENEVIDTTGKYIQKLSEMDDATMLSVLGDQEKVDAVREIQRQANRLGLSVSDLVDRSDELSGRTLIIESLANIGNSLIKIFKSIGDAWVSAFPPITVDTVYDIVAGLYKFSNIIKNYVNDNAEKLTRTLKGLFSVLSVVANIVKGVLRVGFTALKAIMALFGKTTSGVLDITANLGDILVLISNILNEKIIWAFDKIIDLMNFVIDIIKKLIFNNESLMNTFNWVKDGMFGVINSIKDYLTNNEKLNKGIEFVKSNISSLVDKIKEWFKNTDIINTITKTLTSTITNIVNGIKNWYENNERLKSTFENIKESIDRAKESISNWFHSFDGEGGIGKHIIDGLGNGLKAGISKIVDIIIKIANKIKETFCKLFGIESPSKTFFEYGKYIIEGLLNGLKSMFPKLKEIFKNVYDTIKNVSFSQIGSILFPLTSLIPQLGFLNLPRHFANLFAACGFESLEGLKQALDNNGGVLASIKLLAQKIISKFEEILGIKSPSKVFIALGGFIIAGLAIGLKNGFKNIPDIIKGFGEKIVDTFKNLKMNKVVGILIAGGALFILHELIKLFSKLGDVMLAIRKPATSFSGALDKVSSGINDLLNKLGDSQKTKSNASLISSIGMLILSIAASVFIISKIKQEDLWRAVGVVGLIILVVGIMVGLLMFVSKPSTSKQLTLFSNNNGIFGSLMTLAASILLLAIAIKAISNLDLGENANDTILKLIGILGSIILLLGIGQVAGENASKAGSMILKIGIVLLILVKFIKEINQFTWGQLGKAAAVIVGLTLVFTALLELTAYTNEHSSKAGTALLFMTVAMLLMVKVIKSVMDLLKASGGVLEVGKALGVIAIIALIFTLLVDSIGNAEGATKAAALILSFTISLYLLIGAIKLINTLEKGEVTKAGGFILAVIGVFGLLMLFSKMSGENAHKAAALIISFTLALYLLIGVVSILSGFETTELVKAGAFIAGMAVIFGGLMAVSKLAEKSMGSIIAMTVAIAVLVGGLMLLTLMDQDKLRSSAESLGMVILAMAVALAATSKVPNASKSLAAILSMTAAIIAIGIMLKVMDGIDSQGAILNATAISELLLAMSVSLLILSKVQQVSFKALGAMAILGLVVAELAIIFGVMGKFNVQPSIETATALSILLLAMSGCLVILSAVGMTGSAAIAGALQLVAIIGIIGLILVAIGALVEKFPKIEEFINKGGDIFVQIGSILGNFIGNFVAGIAGPLIDLLPKIGQKLSEFMIALTPFLVGVKLVDSNTLKGASFLALAILEMTAAELISGIASFITGGHSLSDLGKELTTFMVNATPFFMMLQMIGPETVNSVKNLAEAILAITKAEFVQGINNFLGFGDKSLSGFGEQLSSLGSGLNGFVKELTDFSPEKVGIVNSACEAIKSLAEANKSIPNSGGLLANIIGDNTLDVFGNSLESLGKGLNSFITQLKDFKPDSVETVKSACEAIKLIADANNSIPNTGGLVSMIIGDNDLGDFGSDLESLGKGLASFVKSLNDNGFNTTDSPALVDAACACIEEIAGLNSSLADSNWYSNILGLGKTDLQKFSEQIPLLAEGINGFVQKLPDFKTEQLEVVRTAIDALLAIGSLGALDLSNIATNMLYFSGALSDLGVGMSTFFNTLTEIGLETIQEGIGKVDQLVAMATTIAETNIEQVSVFSDSLVKVANDGVMGFCNAFSGVIPKEKAKQAVIIMMKSAINGAEVMRPSAIAKFRQIAEQCVGVLRNYYQAFFQAGAYLAQGFADGITSNAGAAIAAAAEMGRRAAQALADATQEQSPSKLTHKMGGYFGEGFIIGIREQFGKVYDTAFNAGDMAKEGLSNAIAKMSQMVEDGIDTSPTIRPVLDLSEVEQGASYLGSMFGTNSVGLRENINSISNGFNSRIQNGSGSDLLNAINKLEATVRGSNGNTLNIYTQELDSEKLDQIVRHVNKELGVIF